MPSSPGGPVIRAVFNRVCGGAVLSGTDRRIRLDKVAGGLARRMPQRFTGAGGRRSDMGGRLDQRVHFALGVLAVSGNALNVSLNVSCRCAICFPLARS